MRAAPQSTARLRTRLMIGKQKITMMAIAAALVVASPAFAQHAARSGGLYATAAAPRSPAFVDRNDPAVTGGGSLGYNRRVEQGF